MASRARTWLVGTWCLSLVTLLVVAVALNIGETPSTERSSAVVTGGLVALIVVMAALAALLFLRRPENRISWVFAAAVTVMTIAIASDPLLRTSSGPGADPSSFITTLALWNAIAMPFGLWLCILLLLLTFPDGRLPSRRWRSVLIVTLLVFGSNIAAVIVRPGPLDHSGLPNPLGWDAASGVAAAVGGMFWPVVSVLTVVAAASLIVRYRASRGVQRQQLKWLALSGLLICMGGIASFVAGNVVHGDDGSLLGTAASLLTATGILSVPVFAALAVLRYRLYDLDRIISRTVSYALLTLLLAGLFVIVVFAMLGLLTMAFGGESQVAVAVATLVVAACFQPARRRIQAGVDRRFNRARYDATVTVRAFAERMRTHLDVEAARHDLLMTAVGVVHPARAAVWIVRGDTRTVRRT